MNVDISVPAADPLVVELLSEFTMQHRYTEDCWYTCPKHPDGCCDDRQDKDVCTCGADAFNTKLKQFGDKLQTRLSSSTTL